MKIACPARTDSEVILSTISGNGDDERLLVVLVHSGEGSRILLRQQSWADGVGWFTQSTIEMAPHQVTELKMALGAAPSAPLRRPRPEAECEFRPTVSLPGVRAFSA